MFGFNWYSLLLFVVSFSFAISTDSQAGISVEELVPGDIVFSLDYSGRADHVGIFAGVQDDGKPYITHAVTKPHDALITTVLNPSDTDYLAYRSTNPVLAHAASERMKAWEKVRVPYDHKAADLMHRFEDDREYCHPKTGTEKHYQYAREMSIPNFYRRIKFGARRGLPNLPKDATIGSRGSGMRCDEAVILAYQVEELSDVLVDCSSCQQDGLWISDKYVTDDILNQTNASEGYRRYQKRLQSGDEYRVPQPDKLHNKDHMTFLPSFLAWNFEKHGPIEDFANAFKTSLPIDSKITSPAVLMFHVQNDAENWTELGKLEVPALKHTPEQKEAWQQRVARRVTDSSLIKSIALSRLKKRARSEGHLETGISTFELKRRQSCEHLDC